MQRKMVLSLDDTADKGDNLRALPQQRLGSS
jgi:hypothetical protein